LRDSRRHPPDICEGKILGDNPPPTVGTEFDFVHGQKPKMEIRNSKIETRYSPPCSREAENRE
jgi:hypothetical protein